MSLLFESILVEDGQLMNLVLHERRLNRSRRILFGRNDPVTLSEELRIPDNCAAGIWKCRVTYGQIIDSVEFCRYLPKLIRTLRLVEDNGLTYEHKFADRSIFDKHCAHAQADDILIVKNGRLTDSSYSNIALFDGSVWWTPSMPLLEGTRRADLLARGLIREAEIRVADLSRYREAVLINAMLDLKTGPVVPIRNILE